jgi:GAF domain-containing protein
MLKRFFSPPIFEDGEEKTRTAGFINVIVLSNIPILALFMVVRISTGSDPFGIANMILLAIIAILTIVWFLMKAGHIRTAGYLHITTIWLASSLIALNGSGIRGTAFMSYCVVMLMAGLILGWKSALGFTILSIISAFGLAYAENVGIIIYIPGPAIDSAIEGTVLLVFSAIFLYLIVTNLQNAVRKANESAGELRNSNQQLTELRDALELRVEDRTRELETRSNELENANTHIQRRAAQFEAIAQVTSAIASIRTLEELLPRITQLISEQFNFYHVGIFLNDASNQYSTLSAANSEGGQKMLARKHQLKIGEQGIVGNVASSGTPRIALDVGEDAVFFSNPDLPDTHSEMAFPLKISEKIVGVLDLQSIESSAFGNEDLQVISILVNQVSLAIENARLFEESNKALAEAEALYRQYLRQAWGRMPKEQHLEGYQYSALGATPIERIVKMPNDGNEEQSKRPEIAVPITLRGESIGVLAVQVPDAGQINNDQMDLIRAVADRVAISAENARLFEETTRRAERERLVTDITAKIRSTNDPEAMIQTTLNELKTALGATKVQLVPHTLQNLNTKTQNAAPPEANPVGKSKRGKRKSGGIK